MGVIIPPGYGEAQYLFGSPDPDGSQPMATMGVILSDPGSDAMAEDLYDAFISSGCLSTMSSHWQLIGVRLRTGDDPGPGPTYEHTETTNGGESGDPVPAQCATLIAKRTALGGRKNRGRFYLPGLLASHVDTDGSIKSGTLSTLQTAFNNLLITYNTITGVGGAVVLHSGAGAPAEVTDLRVEGSLASQRRRARR